jgi:hypothetical protein
MTFDELELLVTIGKLKPGGRDYLTDQERLELVQLVQQQYCLWNRDAHFPYSLDAVVIAYMKYRKNKDTRTKAEIAAAHGTKCFWKHRGKGPCSAEAEAGHLVPKSCGGELSVANCVIECRAHNQERGIMSIEQYLELATPCLTTE